MKEFEIEKDIYSFNYNNKNSILEISAVLNNLGVVASRERIDFINSTWNFEAEFSKGIKEQRILGWNF